jgi:hypothetical protein
MPRPMPAAPLVERRRSLVPRSLPRFESQVVDRGAQAAARGAAQVLDRGAQAVAPGAARCASQELNRLSTAPLVCVAGI